MAFTIGIAVNLSAAQPIAGAQRDSEQRVLMVTLSTAGARARRPPGGVAPARHHFAVPARASRLVTIAMAAEPRLEDLFDFSLERSAVAKRSGWSLLSLTASRAKGVPPSPCNIAVLGAAGYGTTTVALTATALLAPFALLNIPDGAGRLLVGAETPTLAYSYVARIRRAGTVMAVVVTLVGGATAVAAMTPLPFWIGTLTASNLLFKVATIHLQYFQRTARFAKLDVVTEYGAVFAGLALAVPFGVGGMLGANSALTAVGAMVGWRDFSRYHRSASGVIEPPFWRRALALALPLLPSALLQWALLSVDSLLIFGFLGKAPTGAYSSAYSVASVALLMPLAANAVWYATAQRLLAQSKRQLFRYAVTVAALVTVVGIGLVVVAAIVGPVIGRDWLSAPAFRAVPRCLPWLVGGFAILTIAKLGEGILYACGRPRLILGAACAAAVCNLGLNLLWIPAYGIVGAAWATFVGYGALTVFMVGCALAVTRRLV